MPDKSRIRRRLNSIDRTSITSYFTLQEKEQISRAAAAEGVTVSAFVAGAALKEAQRITGKPKPPKK